MEAQQLAALRHLARTGSFSGAARATLRTQPAVSQQIKALEQELGCVLVERVGRRYAGLTPAGQRLLAFCEATREAERDLREDLAAMEGRVFGRLGLAAPLTTLMHLLPPVLKDYAARFPEVELSLWDRPQAEVPAMLRSGEADLGLALDSAAGAGVEARPWHEARPTLLTPRGHPLARRRKRIAPADLAPYRLILPPASSAPAHRLALDELFASAGLEPRVLLESANAELSAALVEQGLGLAFGSVMGKAPRKHWPGLGFVPLDHLLPRARLAVLWRRGRELPAYQRALVEMLLKKA